MLNESDKGDQVAVAEEDDCERALFYSFSEEKEKAVMAKTKPCLSSSNIFQKKKKDQCTAERIEEKLLKAEQRRKEMYNRRVQRTKENRENMMAFAVKLEHLKIHKNSKQLGNSTQRTLSKQEYVKLAHEVALEFENLSSKYSKDLKMADDLEKSINKHD